MNTHSSACVFICAVVGLKQDDWVESDQRTCRDRGSGKLSKEGNYQTASHKKVSTLGIHCDDQLRKIIAGKDCNKVKSPKVGVSSACVRGRKKARAT